MSNMSTMSSKSSKIQHVNPDSKTLTSYAIQINQLIIGLRYAWTPNQIIAKEQIESINFTEKYDIEEQDF